VSSQRLFSFLFDNFSKIQYAFCLNCQIEKFHMDHYKHAKHLDFYVTAVTTILF